MEGCPDSFLARARSNPLGVTINLLFLLVQDMVSMQKSNAHILSNLRR
jgi:hypothetical protein